MLESICHAEDHPLNKDWRDLRGAQARCQQSDEAHAGPDLQHLPPGDQLRRCEQRARQCLSTPRTPVLNTRTSASWGCILALQHMGYTARRLWRVRA